MQGLTFMGSIVDVEVVELNTGVRGEIETLPSGAYRIRLAKALSPSERSAAFLHELIHLVEGHLGLDFKESDVRALARGLSALGAAVDITLGKEE